MSETTDPGMRPPAPTPNPAPTETSDLLAVLARHPSGVAAVISTLVAVAATLGIQFVSPRDLDAVRAEIIAVQYEARERDRRLERIESDQKQMRADAAEYRVLLGEIDRKLWIVCRATEGGCAP